MYILPISWDTSFHKATKIPLNLTWQHHGLLNSCIPPFDTAKSCAIRSMKNTWEYLLLERCNRNASYYKHCLMNSARKYFFSCSSSKGSPGDTLSKSPTSIQQLHKEVLFFPSQEAIVTCLLPPETAASVSSSIKVLHLQQEAGLYLCGLCYGKRSSINPSILSLQAASVRQATVSMTSDLPDSISLLRGL